MSGGARAPRRIVETMVHLTQMLVPGLVEGMFGPGASG